MRDSELHILASLWSGQDARIAALVLQGSAHDRSIGGIAVDALHRIGLARGLRMTTDLDRRDTRPIAGWQVRIDRVHAVSVEWPHRRPLLDRIPLELPSGWLRAARSAGEVLLLVGYGLGLDTGTGQLRSRLDAAARDGALVGGPVAVHVSEPAQVDLPAQRTPGDDRVHARSDDRVFAS